MNSVHYLHRTVAEEEMKRRKKVEEQLQVLQKEREAAVAAATAERNAQAEAAKLAEKSKAKAMEFEAQCAALKTELEALGKNQQKSTGQGTSHLSLPLTLEKLNLEPNSHRSRLSFDQVFQRHS